MVELADTPDLGSGAVRFGGSSPPSRISHFGSSKESVGSRGQWGALTKSFLDLNPLFHVLVHAHEHEHVNGGILPFLRTTSVDGSLL